MTFEELKQKQFRHVYKGQPFRVLADYGEELWIEIDCQRYLISVNDIILEEL